MGKKKQPSNSIATLANVIIKYDFTSLSDEIIVGIFRFLTQKDLCIAAQVNRQFNSLADDKSLRPAIKFFTPFNNQFVFSPKRTLAIKKLKVDIKNRSMMAPEDIQLIVNKRRLTDTQTVANSGMIQEGKVSIATNTYFSNRLQQTSQHESRNKTKNHTQYRLG